VREAGYRVVCAEDTFVHHFGEASFGGLVPTGRYGELFRANKARFEQKWGVSWQSHLRRPNAWYRDLVEEIREAVDRELPPDATVLVVSHGDDELLKLGVERRGWHFPQMEDGTYAGHHPGDSDEAIAHLKALRDRGAGYIVFPKTATWWLEHYREFAEMLEEDSTARVHGGSCEIFSLQGRASATGTRALQPSSFDEGEA
jgi:hypothetical protein